jgi:hypothetical protein
VREAALDAREAELDERERGLRGLSALSHPDAS